MDIAQLHFLVAEGDQVQRHALADILVHLGVGRITQAPDGHTALRHFSASTDIAPAVDIAIIDLALPGMDALELIRRLALTPAAAPASSSSARRPTPCCSRSRPWRTPTASTCWARSASRSSAAA
jgi:CheY-like chemotaxis protein